MTKQLTIKQRTAIALSALGPTSDAIAKTLKTHQVKGHRGTFTECPIAVWLSRLGITSSVGPKNVLLYDGSSELYDTSIGTPAAVVDFVNRFDNNEFQELAA